MALENLSKNLQAAVNSLPQQEVQEPIEQHQTYHPEDNTSSIDDKYRAYTDEEKRDRNTARMRESYENKLKEERRVWEEEKRAWEEEKKELARKARESQASINDDELVEGRHYNKLNEKYDHKIGEVEQKLANYEKELQHQREINTQREQLLDLKRKFPDFDQVVNADTLKKLEKEDPDAFNAINSARDLKSGGSAFYHLIKTFGLSETDESSYDNSRRLEENMRKPRSTPQSHQSNLAKAESFSEEFHRNKRAMNDHNKLVEHYARGGS